MDFPLNICGNSLLIIVYIPKAATASRKNAHNDPTRKHANPFIKLETTPKGHKPITESNKSTKPLSSINTPLIGNRKTHSLIQGLKFTDADVSLFNNHVRTPFRFTVIVLVIIHYLLTFALLSIINIVEI